MSLTKSRKILSVILTVLIALGGILFFSSSLIKYTLCSEAYMTKIFSSDSLYSQCRDNFTDRTAVIEARSGIPAEVFETILDNRTPAGKTAVQRIFTGNNASLYDEALVDEFEELCLEYLNGNSVKYDKEQVHNTAMYAAEVYSDCFGIQNCGRIQAFISNTNSQYGKYASTGLLLLTVSIALLLILFTKKDYVLRVIYSAFTATGLSLFLIGICALIFGLANELMVEPHHYADALTRAVNIIFVIASVTGTVITALAISGSVSQYKKSKHNQES